MLRHLQLTHKEDWDEGTVQVKIQGNISNTVLHTKVYMTGRNRNGKTCKIDTEFDNGIKE